MNPTSRRAVALHFFLLRVARAHAVYGVKLPAITGNPDFDRVYGIQTNTQKWAPIFLPSLWLFAIYREWLWGTDSPSLLMHIPLRHSGMVRRTRPGISNFQGRCCASPRNDAARHFA